MLIYMRLLQNPLQGKNKARGVVHPKGEIVGEQGQILCSQWREPVVTLYQVIRHDSQDRTIKHTRPTQVTSNVTKNSIPYFV